MFFSINIKKNIDKYRKNLIDKILNLLATESNNSFLDQPIFIAKIFSGFIVGSSALGLIWLGTAKTDQIIQSNGFLEPKDRLRAVKIPEKGVIEELLIKEGELVQKGQILLMSLKNKEIPFQFFFQKVYTCLSCIGQFLRNQLQLEK